MDFVKTSISISKTIRNAGRLREIVKIFAKHGFDEFITRGITANIPNFVLTRSGKGLKEELKSAPEYNWSKIIGNRLRLCFEELGPAFVKFGQLLGSREDIFEAGFIDEMHMLRDKVSPLNFSEVKELVERRMECKLTDIFEHIEDKPVGTASIGLVYKATLKNSEEVVLKVRRPHITKEIDTDFSILLFMITQIEKVSEEVKFLGISKVIQEFAISLQNELNFNIEAMNCARLAKNLKRHDVDEIFYIPKVYTEYSNDSILVLEFLNGTAFSDKVEINKRMEELAPKLEKGFSLFIKTFLEDGFFHADLHGGNFFFLENKKIGLIDFGLMGSLSKKSRQSFVAIVYSILTHDFENLVYEFLDVAEYDEMPDTKALIRDMENTLSMFVGLSVRQTDFTNVLHSLTTVMKRHRVFLPREWFIIFRALITMDGVGQSMKMDMDLFSMMEKDIDEIVKNNFNLDHLKEELVWYGKDLITSTRSLPRHLNWFLREFSKNGYMIDVNQKGYEAQFNRLTNSLLFLGMGMISCVFLIGGVIMINDSNIGKLGTVSIFSIVFWSLSFVFLILTIKNYFRCTVSAK